MGKKIRKKSIFVISFCLVLLLALFLTGCSETENSVTKEETDKYYGHTFAGKDPWGGNLKVTVNTIQGNKAQCTYVEELHSSTLKVSLDKVKFPSDTFAINIKHPDACSISFRGKITFQNETITLTYTNGSYQSFSRNAKQEMYDVSELEEEERTVVLTDIGIITDD